MEKSGQEELFFEKSTDAVFKRKKVTSSLNRSRRRYIGPSEASTAASSVRSFARNRHGSATSMVEVPDSQCEEYWASQILSMRGTSMYLRGNKGKGGQQAVQTLAPSHSGGDEADTAESVAADSAYAPSVYEGENGSKNLVAPLVAFGLIEDDDIAKKYAADQDLTFMMFEDRQDIDEFGDLDREWYDLDDSGCFYHHDRNYQLDSSLQAKEEHLKYRQQQLDNAKHSRQNLWDALRNREQDLWELNRLHQSGVNNLGSSQLNPEQAALQYELPSGEVDTESTYHVLVREIKPPFLDGRVVYTSQIESVPTIKDPTSDLAVLARHGSAVVRRLREQEDRTKMRERFWEISGSTVMGQLIGVRDNAKTKEEYEEELLAAEMEDDKNYCHNQAFSQFLQSADETAVSEFARTRTLQEQRESLPIFQVRDEFMQLVRDHRILVVVGQTGSGKTTQLTQYFDEEGYSKNGVIGCTQPRRVAAVSVAKRVSDEMGVQLGKKVGYAIRFEDCTSDQSKIIYMTDGILLRESLTDKDLDRYSVIIMDEAHERSLNTDILFGILKGVVARRYDFRLIVTSATMDATKFAAFFGGCPVFEIPGRTFPVTIKYSRTPVEDYVDAAVQQCLQIHCSLSPTEHADGDILIFMTGQEDIEATCHLIQERASLLGDRIAPLSVLPIYSTLPADLQAKIFQKSKFRKVVVATNIAETSLTLDGVRFVIDCGYSKLKVYNTKIGMDSLQITPISQANAQQRSGRAGRTGPGVCYRLYTERAFVAELFENNIPEIQRTNLNHTVLLLKSLGIDNLLEFDFIDPPPQETILNSMYQLWVLGALDNLGSLTETGSKMIQFPLDPPLAKMLLAAIDQRCTAEILIIVSMLSVPSVFYRPKNRAEESDAAREKFFVPESDHLTLLNAYFQWRAHQNSPSWSSSHFIHQKVRPIVRSKGFGDGQAMKKAREVRGQLLTIMTQQKIENVSSTPNWDVVRKAICSGYFQNASRLRGIGEYVNLRTSIPCHLHPSSALYGAGNTPEYVVYHEAVLTTKEYMQNVTVVEAEWLAELGPMFFYLKRDGSMLAEKRQEEQEELRRHELAFQAQIEEDIRRRQDQERAQQEKIDQLAHKIVVPGVRRQPKTVKGPLAIALLNE